MQCRSNNFLIFPLNEQNANGVVVALDIFLISGGTYPQTIFSFRSSATLDGLLTIELSSDLKVSIFRFASYWFKKVTSADALTLSNILFIHKITWHDARKLIDAWNRVIIEIVQAQPSEFGVGYCSGRIWINGVGMTRTYFSDFSLGEYLFSGIDNVEFMLCARRVSGSFSTIYYGNHDLMNFIWFQGSEGLYVPDPSKWSSSLAC